MRITEHVSFIGIQNPALRVFDIIMKTDYGTSYNSYLVQGEKTAIIETAHEDYVGQYIEQIEAITPVASIDYIILNHTEPDHTGSLRTLMAMNPDIEVYGTAAAIKNIGAITNETYRTHVVKPGETLDLGDGVELSFVIAPNLHWPDSMFTYMAKEKVLFSCDVLGSHYCEPAVWDGYVQKPDLLRKERRNYYDCIFGPFKKFVISGLDKIKDLEIDIACPSHGPVLKEYLQETMDDYRNWSMPAQADPFIAVFYVSAYGYTKQMAECFAAEFQKAGKSVQIYDVSEEDPAQMAEALNTASGVLFGSPTINREALKPIWDLISCTEAINVNKRPALCFGSYGWSGEACRNLTERLRSLKYNVVADGVTCIFRPSEDTEKEIAAAAAQFMEAL